MSEPYCTADDLDRLLSQQGVAAFADHNNDGNADDGVITDCIEQATDEISAYVLRRYDEAAVAGNGLLTRWATVVAVRFLCIRRGNMPPESIEMEFQRIMEPEDGLLARLQSSKFRLPGIPTKSDSSPAFSNLTVDRRRHREKVRVTTGNSSNTATALERDEAGEIYHV